MWLVYYKLQYIVFGSKKMDVKPPKNYISWVRLKKDEDIYIITSYGTDRSKYFLFLLDKEKKSWVKISQNANPSKLEEKVYGKNV